MIDLACFDTEFTADCFESVTNAVSGNKRLASVGTYQYFPEEGQRKGRLYLLELGEDGSLGERHRLDVAGILDMRWTQDRLYCSMSDGTVCCFRLDEDVNLVKEATIEIDPSVIVLSLDHAHGNFVVSCNDGQAALIHADGSEVECWSAHLCEVWCAASDRHDQHLAYTGSDDYSFALWDTRCLVQPSSRVKRHQAGVCILASDPHREHIFASGSYDETGLLWDKRNLKEPLGTFQASSGVWRLKWHPKENGKLLAACMHDGFQVWDTADPGNPRKRAHRPTASIAYGCDWILAEGLPDSCGGATFYNHEAIVWEPHL